MSAPCVGTVLYDVAHSEDEIVVHAKFHVDASVFEFNLKKEEA